MTPEQFAEFAKVLPEPVLFLSQTGEVIAVNKSVTSLLSWHSKELQGKLLFDFVTNSEEAVIQYLQTCSRSRKMVLGSLAFRTSDGAEIVCRSEGAVIQPASAESPAQILLRLEKQSEVNKNFILLNRKIEELQAEITQRRKAEGELKQTLNELQKTQIQLIHQEKLSGLGQVTAGIAHEINNPVSFIHGNLLPTQEYAQDLMRLIQLYQKHYPNPVPEIATEIEEMDLEFVMKDFLALLQSMQMGTERIRQIVKSMRTFSRLDEADIKDVDLHEGLESTLIILKHRLKETSNTAEIQIIKMYGKLPKVECYPGQMNQVFMNILSNAIDALHECQQQQTLNRVQRDSFQIKIQTEVLDNSWALIRISDNGLGVSQSVMSKIFDPFFTTKEVGKGTGLGLSISYKIVTEKHRGKLSCHSELGQGTEFVIQIPIRAGT